jgi:CelD/BcsL family acetyltransferase involved in cellulose biosynthesis
VEAEFTKFVDMHTTQWSSEGRPGHFGAWPDAAGFHFDLIRELGKNNALRLIRIIADGTVISYQYCYRFGDSYYWELPARLLGGKWEQFSLGSSGVVTMINEAIREGINKIEAGPGGYEYKVRLGAIEFGTKIIRVGRRGLKTAIKGKVVLLISFVIDVIYHKIWYRRIQPRMPRMMRWGIWSGWFRLQC